MTVEWKDVDGGEYNETVANVHGHTLVVYSWDGDHWFYGIDGYPCYVGNFRSKEEAQKEAIADIQERD